MTEKIFLVKDEAGTLYLTDKKIELTKEEIDGGLKEWDKFKREVAYREARLVERQQEISKWVKEKYPNLWSILKKLEMI